MPKLLTRRSGKSRGAASFGVTDSKRIKAAEWHRAGVHLLNQQLWRWGQDVRFPAGNLLVRHGFRRIARPADQHGSSIYRLELNDRQRIVLRGFGVFVGDDRRGGMFLKRFEFSPWITPSVDLHVPAWQVDDLPHLTSPSSDQDLANCRQLLAALIDWTCDYERWVRQVAGAPYRRQVIASWQAMSKGGITPSHMVSRAWRSLQTGLAGQIKSVSLG